jgi:hypothetical protein
VRFSNSLLITLTKISRFIEENKSYKIASQERQSQQVSQPGRPSQDMMSFWGKISMPSILSISLTFSGYKFETLCLLPATWADTPREYIENRENEVVNNYAQYCSVVKTGMSVIPCFFLSICKGAWLPCNAVGTMAAMLQISKTSIRMQH